MALSSEAGPVSKRKLWIGRDLGGIAVLFLLFDAAGKVMRAAPSVEGTVQLGYPESAVAGIGLILLVCVILHVIPKTSILGAILLTGYLGGAVASHVRVENPLFSQALFPMYLGVLIWGGLFLREDRLRALFPWRTSKPPAVQPLEQTLNVEAPTG